MANYNTYRLCHMWWDHKRHMYNCNYGKETFYNNVILFSIERLPITIPRLRNQSKLILLFGQDMKGIVDWKTLFD